MAVKVVCNDCYGGFSLSKEAIKWLAERGVETGVYSDLPRHHPLLVQCVEELGDDADGDMASLYVHTLKGNKYIIKEYDGLERAVEPDYIQWIVVEG